MLQRKITKVLQAWKQETHKPCLLIRGARQVGKTFIVDEFARANYPHYIYINFELSPEHKEIFRQGNLDFDTIRIQLESFFPDVKIVRGQTLLFLDEIQACPQARTALKSLALDGTLDVIASGSLLGLYYKDVSSYPVGYERALDMYPLDFEEYLWAIGVSTQVINNLHRHFILGQALPTALIKKMSEYFRDYILVGGMPAAVNEFIRQKSFVSVRTIQTQILEAYKTDVVKYASTPDKGKIIKTFASIPAQLARKNKKFLFSQIDAQDDHASERKYISALLWLQDAGIINYCYNLSEPALPLAVNKRLEAYKIYLRDTGLLLAMLDRDISQSILHYNWTVNEGMILEIIFAQEIISRYGELTYFERKSRLEIDFIMNINGIVTAIEVKSGHNRQAKSLQSIKDNYPSVRRWIKFEPDINLTRDEKDIEHYPLFMAMFL